MTPEGKLKKKIIDFLRDAGAWYDLPVRTGYGRSGVPDILVCYRGRFLAFEVKADKAKVATAWQRREIAAIIEAGGIAEVVWSVNQVQEALARVVLAAA